MKAAIVYCSRHQGNTKKLVDAIAQTYPVDIFNVYDLQGDINWQDYDVVGIASGVYMEKFYTPILEFAEKYVSADQKLFLLFSSGAPGAARFKAIKEIIDRRGAHILGVYGCRGHYSFFPFSLVGGRRKGHPNAEEIAGAPAFFADLCRQFETGTFEYIQTIHTKI